MGRPFDESKRLTESEFEVACTAAGIYDTDNMAVSYLAAKSVMVYNHQGKEAARVFGITPQSVSEAITKLHNALTALPGKHRKCPCCGKEMEEGRGWTQQ